MEQVHQQDRHHAVRTYATYPEAKRAVDALSDEGFPVEHLSIVAEEVQLVEDITGRRHFRTAAGHGLFPRDHGHTKDELYQRARELDISGRWSMTKMELGKAIARKQD